MLRNLGLQAVPLHGQMTQVSKTVTVKISNAHISNLEYTNCSKGSIAFSTIGCPCCNWQLCLEKDRKGKSLLATKIYVCFSSYRR